MHFGTLKVHLNNKLKEKHFFKMIVIILETNLIKNESKNI